MSQEKKDAPDDEQELITIEYSDSILPPSTSQSPASPAIEKPVQDTRDRVTFSTTFVEDVDLLAKYNMDYQLLMALQDDENECRNLTFPNLLQTLRNVVEQYDYLYKKRFAIPDRLVALKFTCLDGDFYLGLNNGYLCFYKEPYQRCRTPFPIVDEPFTVNRILPN
jgi:hypothetical protein